VAGYLLFPVAGDWPELCRLFVGVVLLAAAGSALNQLLERDADALMGRTRLRPLPTGVLSPATAMLAGTICAVTGFSVLYLADELPAWLGAGALVWYLAVYTPLKRRSSLALAVGAVCGALPPVIGWCAAGGEAGDFRIVLLAGVFYLWQVPHFWLLQRRHADDYRKAGFLIFDPAQRGGTLGQFCRLWVAAMGAGAMLLPVFGLVGRGAGLYLCVAVLALPLLSTLLKSREKWLFASLNVFPLLITAVIVSSR
jgi:protoheme IX farnesyltransferase